jgi:hypothetical protein
MEPQRKPPPGFDPQSLADLMTAQGQAEIMQFCDRLYDWLLLVDKWSPRLKIHRDQAKRRLSMCTAAAVIDGEELARCLALEPTGHFLNTVRMCFYRKVDASPDVKRLKLHIDHVTTQIRRTSSHFGRWMWECTVCPPG